MIRLIFLYSLVAGLCTIAAWRWYVSLCGLLFLITLLQHPDFPRAMMGIQGANAWNLVLVVICVFWALQRRYEPRTRPVPFHLQAVLLAYIVMVITAGVTGLIDREQIRGFAAGKGNFQWIMIDGIINPLKYFVVGLLFFDGTRTRQRAWMALLASVGSAMCYAFLLFKSAKQEVFTMGVDDARRLTDKLIGLFANDVGQLWAYAIWAGILLIPLFAVRWQRWLWILAVAATVPPFLSVKSRAGFLAFAAIGAALGVVRWRRLLIYGPLATVLVVALVPSVRERIFEGVGRGEQETNWNEVSAGRLTHIWPPVIEQIGQAPFFGHGRWAILRTGCYEQILVLEREVPSHPHCSYLEVLLDAGMVGLAICLTFVGLIINAAVRTVRKSRDPVYATLGAVALAAVAAELAAGIAGSSFWGTQSSVVYFAVYGAALRVYYEYVREPAAEELPAGVPLLLVSPKPRPHTPVVS